MSQKRNSRDGERGICNTVTVISGGVVCAGNVNKRTLPYYFSLPQGRIFLFPLINPAGNFPMGKPI